MEEEIFWVCMPSERSLTQEHSTRSSSGRTERSHGDSVHCRLRGPQLALLKRAATAPERTELVALNLDSFPCSAFTRRTATSRAPDERTEKKGDPKNRQNSTKSKGFAPKLGTNAIQLTTNLFPKNSCLGLIQTQRN
jgi:hypothetical protein